MGARSLNIGEKLIYRWKQQHKNQVGIDKTGQADEIERLEAQLNPPELKHDMSKNHRTGRMSGRCGDLQYGRYLSLKMYLEKRKRLT